MVTKNLPVQHYSDNLSIPQRKQIFDAFRRWGFMQAKLDPLGQYLLPEPVPELNLEGEEAEERMSRREGRVALRLRLHNPGPREEGRSSV